MNRSSQSLARVMIFVALGSSSLIGCGEAIPEVAAPVAAPVKRAATEGAAATVATEEYFYNPAGKRDPFKPFYETNKGSVAPPDPNSPPLQRWDVDKFLLTGVIWNTSVPQALLIDPEGIGHVVAMGSYVGRNWGKVTSISDHSVVVTEEYQTMDGELVVNPVTVHFPGQDKK